jgi:Ricin-type beta-trefoil lectin domain
MNLHRIKSAALITCTVIAAFIPMATSAQAASSASTASQQAAASPSCTYAVANLNFAYYGPAADQSLAWSSENSDAMLGNVKTSSPLDCFKQLSYGNNQWAFKQYSSGFCLNVAGNSHAVGAWIILYPCVSSTNELFREDASGGDIQLQSESSGLCIDLRSGLNVYSNLEQKPCGKFGDIYQTWYVEHQIQK